VSRVSGSIGDGMDRVNQPRGRICFVAVPFDTDASPVMKSLVNRGIECRRRDRFEWSTTLETLTELISEADFVCVFSPSVLPPNLLLEIGVAIGMRKPIFMVVAEDLPLPADLRSISFVSADQWKTEIIEPHLDAFLETLPKKNPSHSPTTKSAVGRLDLSHEREQLSRIEGEASPREFESFVATLFRKAGINVTASPLEDFGADLALSSPAIKRRFGNPILVELKRSRIGSDLSFAADRLAELIASGRGSAALLVTLGSVPLESGAFTNVTGKRLPIYRLSLKELIDSLENGELIDRLWADRNKKTHHKD
jgi:Restriction endonuclease